MLITFIIHVPIPVYVCLWVRVHVGIRVQVRACVHICVQVRVRDCVQVCVQVYVKVCVQMCAQIHVKGHVGVHVGVCKSSKSMWTSTWMSTNAEMMIPPFPSSSVFTIAARWIHFWPGYEPVTLGYLMANTPVLFSVRWRRYRKM
jgi:hypothetical protein